LGSLAALGSATGGGRYLRASNELDVSHTVVELGGQGPPLTIALLADLHAPQPGYDFGRLAAATNAQRPDLVLIAGDAINRRGDEGLVEEYSRLVARWGKHAAPGNWENWGRVHRGELAAHYARAGVTWLDNAIVDVAGLGVRLVGLDESTNGRPDARLVSASTDCLTIVLHHSPGAFDRLPFPASCPVLMVSGHTHGGQVAPMGIPLVLPPGSGGYARGLYGRGPLRLYVSRGLGNSHVPVRIGSRPELAVLHVRRVG
jgi:predicted MPP superfamily phosphohydrolase